MQFIYEHFRFAVGTLVAFFLATIAFDAWAEFPGAPPFDLPDRGQIRLQMGEEIELVDDPLIVNIDHEPRRFVYVRPSVPPENSGDYPNGVQQLINVQSKCLLATPMPGAKLTALSTTGGSGTGKVGVGPDSLGTPDGPKGVACYRVSANKNETIDFALGSDTTTPPAEPSDPEPPVLPAGTIDANAFYALALDLEVKKNANILLEIMINGSVTETYELRSGGTIVEGEGVDDPEELPAIFNCAARSDSGPDAGLADNCYWLVKAIGNGFRLRNKDGSAGEFSWEGGGDFFTAGTAFANNSVIYLTKVEDIGALGCDTNPDPDTTAKIGDGSTAAQCQIIRQDPGDGSCDISVSYVFRSDLTDNACEFITQNDLQTVMNIFIEFKPETAIGLPSSDPWEGQPLTRVSFGSDPVPNRDFPIQRCDSTLAPGNSDKLDDGPPPIPNVPDLVPETATTIEYACVFSRQERWLIGDLVQVLEGIQFYGDIRWNR
jgi:hypothetical protein